MKKANLELDTLGKIIILVVIILILVLIAYLMKDKIVDILEKAAKIMRFRA